MNGFIDLGMFGEWVGDSDITVSDLEKVVAKLKKKYGSNSIVRFDAGANNVSVMLKPSKKQRSK